MNELIFSTGIPEKGGWYLVKLKKTLKYPSDPGYDIDFMYTKPDNLKMMWNKHNFNDISGWIKLPEVAQ